jgi:hypothetical protein
MSRLIRIYLSVLGILCAMTVGPLCHAVNVAAGDKLDMPPAPPTQLTRASQGQPFAPLQLQNGSPQFARPIVPPLRTTADGRVGITVKGSTVNFHLLRPESVDASLKGGSFMTGPNGLGELLVPGAQGFNVSTSALYPKAGISPHHMAICNGLPDYRQGVRGETGPYGLFQNATPEPSFVGVKSCGANDCYSFKVISTVDLSGGGVQIWSTPVSVTVSSPKTPSAFISSVNIDAARADFTQIDAFSSFLEPMVTADGRLIVGRTANTSWNFNGVVQRWNMSYAYTDNACNVKGWKNFKPIQNAFFDDEINKRYGFAKYRLRDSSGTPIRQNEAFPGSYPWIDRNGTNLFFNLLGDQSPLYYGSKTAYRSAPAPGGYANSDIAAMESTPARGVAVAGLWTHGKTVLLDSVVLNNSDFGLDVSNSRLINLYSNRAPALVGSTRVNSKSQTPKVGTFNDSNINIIDSLENLFAFSAAYQPRTPRDVVWPISDGKGTDEVPFDDYIDENIFVYSDMNAAFSGADYLNGFSATGSFNSANIRLQNASTSTLSGWNPPTYGAVAGNVRIEPVAGGGIKGKGFYLRPNSSVTYDYSNDCANPAGAPCLNRNVAPGADWYVGLALASTTPSTTSKATLITWADGARVDLLNGQVLRLFEGSGAQLGDVTIPTTQLNGYGYAHIGFVKQRNQRLTVLINGMPLAQFKGVKTFGMNSSRASSSIVLGGGQFSGWIDEFKVVSNRTYASNANVMGQMSMDALGFNPEVLCNYAGGTLFVASSGALFNSSASYQQLFAISEVGRLLGKAGKALVSGQRVACHVNYGDELGASHRDVVAGAVSVRSLVLTPEGQLAVNRPRPDTQANAFCSSCHTLAPTLWRPLSVQALVSSSALAHGQTLNMWQDSRRQPLQRPRYIFGNNSPSNPSGLGLPPGYWQTN